MEVKEWTYEEFPEFTEKVEGAAVLATSGDEMDVHYVHNVKYETEGSVTLYRRLKECGGDVQLYLIQGADHGGAEFWTKQALDIADGFIRECLAD